MVASSTELPSLRSAAAKLRIAGLLDNIGRTPYDELREILLKTLVQPIWRKRPELQCVRAILGSLTLPSVREFEQGKRESYEFSVRVRFQSPGRASQNESSLSQMRVKTRPPEFLFPVETDSWLTLLRLGLGLEVRFMHSRSN